VDIVVEVIGAWNRRSTTSSGLSAVASTS
jgi:hypothetical protein